MKKGVNKIKDFTDAELKEYEGIYSKIVFAMDEVQPFLSEEVYNNRRYVSKVDELRSYIDKIKDANYKAEQTGLFSSDEKFKVELIRFKRTIEEDLDKLSRCTTCACLSCDNDECEFNSCLGCRQKAYVAACDKERNTLIKFDQWVLDLTDNDSGSKDRYEVLGIVEDAAYEQQYILMQNIHNEDDKLVMKYIAGLKEDSYEEITNPEEFDQVVAYFMNAS